MTSNNIYISRQANQQFLQKLAISLANPKALPVLFQVYGISGVGKSTLLNQLPIQHPQAIIARVDFNGKGTEAPLKLMDALYQDINEQFAKLGILQVSDWEAAPEPDAFGTLKGKFYQALQQNSSQLSASKPANDSEQRTLNQNLLELGSQIFTSPMGSQDVKLGAFGKTMGMLAHISPLLQRLLQGKPDPETEALLREPLPKFTQAFIEWLQQKANLRPIILVLDTYEKANSTIDSWVCQYLLAKPEALQSSNSAIRIVIAGQRRLWKTAPWWQNWQKDHQEFIHEQELQVFSEKETQTYLKQDGEIPENDFKKIYKQTNGLPYDLDKVCQQKISISRVKQERADLLLQGMTANQKLIVKLAACCRWFDGEIIQYLVKKRDLDFATAADSPVDCLDCLEWLIKQSFVYKVDNDYRIEDSARDAFRRSFHQDYEEEFYQTHGWLAEYFEDKGNLEIPPDRPEPEKYEDFHWCNYITESLYYVMFSRQQEAKHKFLSHWLVNYWLQKINFATNAFTAIAADTNLEDAQDCLLIDRNRRFLVAIKPVIEYAWIAINRQLGNYSSISYEINNQQFSFTKAQIEVALQAFFKQIDLEKLESLPKFIALLFKLVQSMSTQKEQIKDWLDQAEVEAEKVVTQDCCNTDPDFASSIFLNLSNFKLVFGEYQKAIVNCDKALKINDDLWTAWQVRGQALCLLEQYNEALIDFDRALEIKKDLPEVYAYQGLSLLGLRCYQEAILNFSKALEINPAYVESLNGRGLALSLLGKFDEALADTQQVLKSQPNEPLYLANQGIILARAGRYSEGLDSCEKAIKMQPKHPGGYYGKACCYALQDNTALAIANLQQAIKLDPQLCRREAKTNPDFDRIRHEAEFQALMQG